MTLLFMHITKTAGGSLKEAMRKSDADVVFHYRDEDGWNPQFKYERKPAVLFGHYIFGAHERMEVPPQYGCFLREPVARSISHYYHLKNNDLGPVGTRLRTYDSLESYLLEGQHWEFDNFLCRVISGVGNKPKFGNVGFNVYAQARKNLIEYFQFIGLFERMTESLERLRKVVPSLDIDLPMVNRGSYTKEIAPDALRLVQALNNYDKLLYEDAAALFSAGDHN